ncbi:hypothetical protein PFISCL1PPCAC_28083 [Pristionchus fissidentatus]|uniref:Major facilitator superfamily (MFS) profile domain-containing protein n=1 Tax=Pristionchus fissidentatus TaxID=1538716 RepID=A0AAV5X032_9BILA|nr:hypothetical protein PFISCL1PPCAC_28083 [Pristionchus fissidentatus]
MVNFGRDHCRAMEVDKPMDEDEAYSSVEENSLLKEDILLPTTIEMTKTRNLDDFLKFGRYTVLVLFLAEFVCLSTLSTMIYMVYAGHSPSVLGCGETTFDPSLNNTERCKLYESMKNTSCTLQLSYQFKSVNVEFDLLCSDSMLVKSSTTIQMSAVFLGALAFGQSSDLFGRRFALMIALSCSAVFTGISSFSVDIFTFNIWRGLTGFFAGGITAVQGVYLVENIPVKHRMLVNTIVTWSPNFIIYPIIAYVAGEWRRLAAISAVVNLLGVAVLIFCYESPRFLIQKGRIAEARRVLKDIRRFNKDSCENRSQEIEEMLIAEKEAFTEAHKKNHTFLTIFKNAELLRWTFVLCFGIMTTSLINYGILFNMDTIIGSLYLNNIFFGIIRWGLNIIVGLSDYKIKAAGRKLLNTGSETLNLCCLLFIFCIYYFELYNDYSNAIRVVAIMVTAMCGQVYIAKYITATELYPTSVRNLGCSAQAMFSRIGTILSTQLFFLGDLHISYPYLALSLFLFADIILFQTMIPETKGRKLENHLQKRVKVAKPSTVSLPRP